VGFLKVLLCALLIDLSYRRRRVAYNHVRQDCRVKRWYPHRPLPVAIYYVMSGTLANISVRQMAFTTAS
jgi:hypothetical protein